MTRRQFLYNGSAAMAAMAVFPAIASDKTANAGRNFRSLAQIPYSQLAAQIQTQFRVYAPSGSVVKLKLLKAPLASPSPVLPGRRPPMDAGNEKFSLVFSGPRDELLPAAIHLFEHDELGRFNMYLGQIGLQDSGWVRYQSVFNRPALEQVQL
jgi:hypothetical protein